MSDKLRGGSTVAGGLIWHSGNDGAGSGLDADLLDGQQGSYYVNTDEVNTTAQTQAANALSTAANRTYSIQFDSLDKLVVNVPWTDNNTTYSVATNTVEGLVKIGFPEDGKNYPVELNASDQMYVNVPWTDNNTTYSVATNTVDGLVKIGFPEDGKNYPVELNASDQMYVNVPWTDTVYSLPEATSTTRGGIELFSDTDQSVAANAVTATAGRTYGIQLNSAGQAVVNVPWVNTDTNTDTLQSIGNDTADSDRYITFVASATGAQTGLSNASLRYNPTKKVLTLPDFGLISNTATTTSTTQTAILSFSATTYAGAKIVVNATTGVNRHICEILVAHDGTTAIATQYGSVTTASDLGTYDVDISGGSVRLLATSASATSTTYKVSGTLMEA